MTKLNFDSSETFRDHTGYSHRIIRRLHEGVEDNHWLTFVSETENKYYIWRSDKQGDMWWTAWDKDYIKVMVTWMEIERDELPRIELGANGFLVESEALLMDLDAMIHVIPRNVFSSSLTLEKWMIELLVDGENIPCVFYVYGKRRVEFMNLFARLDEPMIVRLRKFELC